jgi:L-ascorbate metabolism protein UlaG (beta-lactamase superfamily)
MTLQGPSSAHEDVTVLSVTHKHNDVICVYIELPRTQKGHSVYA